MLQSKHNIGSMDRRITFQEPLFSVDASNQKKITGWQNITTNPTVFANVDEVSGSEAIQAEQLNGLKASTFIIRYREDLSIENRILYSGEKYDIHVILQVARKRGLKIVAVSGGKYTE